MSTVYYTKEFKRLLIMAKAIGFTPRLCPFWPIIDELEIRPSTNRHDQQRELLLVTLLTEWLEHRYHLTITYTAHVITEDLCPILITHNGNSGETITHSTNMHSTKLSAMLEGLEMGIMFINEQVEKHRHTI